MTFVDYLNSINTPIVEEQLINDLAEFDLTLEHIYLIGERIIAADFFREQLLETICNHPLYGNQSFPFYLLDYLIDHRNNSAFQKSYLNILLEHIPTDTFNQPFFVTHYPSSAWENRNYPNYYSYLAWTDKKVNELLPIFKKKGIDLSSVGGYSTLLYWLGRNTTQSTQTVKILLNLGVKNITPPENPLLYSAVLKFIGAESMDYNSEFLDFIKFYDQSLTYRNSSGNTLLHDLVALGDFNLASAKTSMRQQQRVMRLLQMLHYIKDENFNYINNKGENPLFGIQDIQSFYLLNLFANEDIGWQQKNLKGEDIISHLVNKFSLEQVALHLYECCKEGFLQPLAEYSYKFLNQTGFEELLHNVFLHGPPPEIEGYPMNNSVLVHYHFFDLWINNKLENDPTAYYHASQLLGAIEKLASYTLVKKPNLDLMQFYYQHFDLDVLKSYHGEEQEILSPYLKLIHSYTTEEKNHLEATKYYFPNQRVSHHSHLAQAWSNWINSFPYNIKSSVIETIVGYINKKYPKPAEPKVEAPVEVATEDTVELYTKESLNRLDQLTKASEDGAKKAREFIAQEKKGLIKPNKTFATSYHVLDSIEDLARKFPHFSEVIEHIGNHCTLQEAGNGRFFLPPMLLAGGPGVGKTFFSHTLADLVETYFHVFHMESMSAAFPLTGLEDSWSSSKPGQIFTILKNEKKINPIFLLDELDKAKGDDNYSPGPALLPLLERYTAANFKDECIPLEIDASHIVWIATANNLSLISAPLQSRFDIFNIPAPNFNERKSLIKGIFSNIIANHSWGKNFTGEMSDTVLDVLADFNTPGASRDLQRNLITACSKALKNNRNTIHLEDLLIIPSDNKMPWDITTTFIR